MERREASGNTLKIVATKSELETVRALVREYMEYLSVDLSFQDIEAELAGLPGKYAPPGGGLFLAWRTSAKGTQEAAGCVALRDLGGGVCEMKRLFVRPEYRGCGVGKALADRAILEARRLGYAKMRLDTLDRLEEAVGLYRSMGFREIPPTAKTPFRERCSGKKRSENAEFGLDSEGLLIERNDRENIGLPVQHTVLTVLN